jgi:serralysin
MSGTVSGGTVVQQFTGTAGAILNTFFNSGTSFTVLPTTSGDYAASGPVVVSAPDLALTISGATAIADTSTGGNSITTTTPSSVFTAPNDTVNSAAATTLFGASGGGINHFSISGDDSSITGGTSSIVGTASGSNSTLVGGTGISIYTVTGPNSLAVGGSAGITGIDESGSTGPETIATNPLGNSGTLVAILGSGADTVLGGSGASTITGGSGNDVFAFIKGHAGGSEEIIGFTASDNLAFAGYGYTATNLPTETLGAGGDVITLSDGTTITLAGFDHKIFSSS